MAKPNELVIATFSDERAAREALKALKDWGKSQDIKVVKSAVLEKDKNGKTKVDQDQDVSAGEGTVFGAVVGAVLGMLGGPGGAVVGAAAGAATGGVTAAAVNLGFSDEDLNAIRTSLMPGSSALVTLIEDRYVESMSRELNKRSGRVWHRPIPDNYGK
jgi:uncharacterized membrane protein